MKAQLTVEFLFTFLIHLVFISIFLTAIHLMVSDSEKFFHYSDEKIKLEEVARGADAWSYVDYPLVIDLNFNNKFYDNVIMGEYANSTSLAYKGVPYAEEN